MSRRQFLILHGPNLDLLGKRQPDVYGRTTLAQVNAMIARRADELGVAVDARQHNYEDELVEAVRQSASEGYSGIVINPAAYTHTSRAIPEAVRRCGVPVIEVHLTNVHAREPFRRLSLVAPVAVGTIAGFGPDGYLLALDQLVRMTSKKAAKKKSTKKTTKSRRAPRVG